MIAVVWLRWQRRFAFVAFATALGCTPEGATPLPEPPALSPDRVGIDPAGVTVMSGTPLVGEPGAVTPGAIVEATNLDDTSAPVSVTASADGSFALVANAVVGDEVRLIPRLGATRGEAVDVVLLDGEVVVDARHGCIELTPGTVLAVAPGSAELSLRNGCAAPASLEAPRARLGLSDFTFGEELPLTLEPGESAPLRIEFEPTAPGAREDVLFVDVDVAGETHRYAVTVVSDG
ncbi:MAG TPA: hypothetical protein VKY73_03110 [Polyangiaceae bacterium]|nr:hypothetical protein [Polyangiaceae bacterium]